MSEDTPAPAAPRTTAWKIRTALTLTGLIAGGVGIFLAVQNHGSEVHDGLWLVGKDIAPGTYTTTGTSTAACYWARLSSTNDDPANVIDDGNVGYGEHATVTIKATDVAFESLRCGSWTKI